MNRNPTEQQRMTRAVNRTRAALIAKAQRSGIYENFGQAEVMRLRDTFGWTPEIHALGEWCSTYTGNNVRRVL